MFLCSEDHNTYPDYHVIPRLSRPQIYTTALYASQSCFASFKRRLGKIASYWNSFLISRKGRLGYLSMRVTWQCNTTVGWTHSQCCGKSTERPQKHTTSSLQTLTSTTAYQRLRRLVRIDSLGCSTCVTGLELHQKCIWDTLGINPRTGRDDVLWRLRFNGIKPRCVDSGNVPTHHRHDVLLQWVLSNIAPCTPL